MYVLCASSASYTTHCIHMHRYVHCAVCMYGRNYMHIRTYVCMYISTVLSYGVMYCMYIWTHLSAGDTQVTKVMTWYTYMFVQDSPFSNYKLVIRAMSTKVIYDGLSYPVTYDDDGDWCDTILPSTQECPRVKSVRKPTLAREWLPDQLGGISIAALRVHIGLETECAEKGLHTEQQVVGQPRHSILLKQKWMKTVGTYI